MKGPNQNRALFDAITNIDDDLIDEAAAPRVLKFPDVVRKIAAVAAVLAILLTALLWPASDENYVTGPGLLVVRAYALDQPTISEENSVILKEGITLPYEYGYSSGINVISFGLPLQLAVLEEEYGEKQITFEVFLSGGAFRQEPLIVDENGTPLGEEGFLGVKDFDNYAIWTSAYLGKHFTVNNKKVIYWHPNTMVFDEENREYKFESPFQGMQAFADIIVRADDHIVGYAVLSLSRHEKLTETYYAEIMKTVSFPQVDGYFQEVTEKYVNEQFQKIHANT